MAEEKTVDLDTSGPGAEIVLEDKENKEEVSVETSNENNNESTSTSEESNQQLDVQTSEQKVETTETKPEETTETQAEEKPEATESDEYQPSEQDLKKYSAQVRRRIGKEVAKRKEAERQRDEVSQYTKMILEERDKLKTRLTKLDTNYVTEVESRIKSGVQAAEAKLASARESGDIKSEIEAQKEIARLGYEEARLIDLKTSQTKEKPVEETKQQPQQQYVQPQQRPEIDEKTQEWIEKNKSWFGKVRGMTATAYDIHDSLLKEGYDATEDEYFDELDRRLRVEFPSKFDTVEKPTAAKANKPAQTVASAKRPAATGRKNTVQLTPTEVAIANKLGVSLEDYAKEKYAKGV